MIDFWIFPLSTIWGAYHLCGFSAFVLSNGSSLALFVGGVIEMGYVFGTYDWRRLCGYFIYE